MSTDYIYKVDPNLPNKDKIEDINDMVIYLEGLCEKGRFNKNELDHIYDMSNYDRKFLREQAIGSTISTYSGWTHLKAESGYSIWKYTPTTYAYNTNNALYFDNKKLSFKGLATAESAVAYDTVYTYDGASYTNVTTEAGTETGTEFSVLANTRSYVYIGLSTTFSGTKIEFQTRGSGYGIQLEYYNQSSGGDWAPLYTTIDSLVDNTSNFESDGTITWTIPDDWAQVAVNGTTKYWIRISTTTAPTTTAKMYYIIPGNNVISLLALSSSEVQNEAWSWCSYGTAIYTTIRNAGNTAYEGNYYITSSSSANNLKNYFIYNHNYTADYQDSTYDVISYMYSSGSITSSQKIIFADATNGNITITPPVASENEGRRIIIKKMNSANTVTIDPTSGETIDGSGTKVLSTQYSHVEIISDGADWYIIGE